MYLREILKKLHELGPVSESTLVSDEGSVYWGDPNSPSILLKVEDSAPLSKGETVEGLVWLLNNGLPLLLRLQGELSPENDDAELTVDPDDFPLF